MSTKLNPCGDSIKIWKGKFLKYSPTCKTSKPKSKSNVYPKDIKEKASRSWANSQTADQNSRGQSVPRLPPPTAGLSCNCRRFEMSENSEKTPEKDSQLSPSSRSLTPSGRRINEEASNSNLPSNSPRLSPRFSDRSPTKSSILGSNDWCYWGARPKTSLSEETSISNSSSSSPRFLDRVTGAIGGARPKTSFNIGQKRKSKKASETEDGQSPRKCASPVSVADKFKASQAPLATSSCSSLNSSEELDSDSQAAGYSSGKSSADNSPRFEKCKSKSRVLKATPVSTLKKIFKRSRKQKDELKMNLMECEKTNIEEVVKETGGKTKKKKAREFSEYNFVTRNYSQATIGRTPSTGPESDPTNISELDSELSSPEKEMSLLHIDQPHSSSSRDELPGSSVPNPSRESRKEKHEPRATLVRDESRQKRFSPYSSPGKICECKSRYNHESGCPILKRKKEIHNRKKGLAPPRRKPKSPSPKRS
ncbi:hypothetical protein TNIN_244401 [Trichonephila inaurata madagascariensis]|uniref:Uncharacterized protein n=1 Tax=Trichonephila inaurata madagascariensis TaxID=2747483 RepID=A0A8X6WPD6_9ARAC|nr:hypothetical protein TNIN_244401 [Trichonephila inaurata madagascariensis]